MTSAQGLLTTIGSVKDGAMGTTHAVALALKILQKQAEGPCSAISILWHRDVCSSALASVGRLRRFAGVVPQNAAD